ncbi:MAG: Ribonucleotide reductase transcriptional regulator NrdR [uncultured Thermomicrobiales bacterium]|uniref:Transcriptional repressor NrdR n=1 Tax=uncultured Thermomicrobiales bacterium TaxID=1645740 RepID=A0A6J4VS51_9BACT|nr:MAG: Ribonucleotide reductase transcriptional regulator NrdR [uncultured Thermomicrobiales bacterium]
MRCPYCHSGDSRVVDSRELSSGESIRRRRECGNCGRRFTTYERVEGVGLIVVKKDGRRQEFDPAKLRQKLRVALTKRPIGEAEIDALLKRVETDLLTLGAAEVPSSAIGEAVLRRLKALDEVAYIRFASVYRQFGDIDDLRREVEGLRPEAVPTVGGSGADGESAPAGTNVERGTDADG